MLENLEYEEDLAQTINTPEENNNNSNNNKLNIEQPLAYEGNEFSYI